MKDRPLKITYSLFEAKSTTCADKGNDVEMILCYSGFETELAALEFIAGLDGFKEYYIFKKIEKNWV